VVRRDRSDEAVRERYWNEDYVRYWRERVKEANQGGSLTSDMVAGDAKTSSDTSYVNAITFLQIGASDTVLELGCGFGRSLPLLGDAALHVTAVDISKEMISEAKKATTATNITFHVSPSETLPLSDGMFDVVVCFAAFDAMYQAEALVEMNRVSRIGARILVTGKNDDYYDDDTAALDAEVGARVKHHPNYFTDVKKLTGNIERFGFRVESQRYYHKRGDFGRGVSDDTMPERYYEYLLVLGKVAECDQTSPLSISDRVSKTYSRLQTVG
jgi:ubiquinone/menaquinone biosynthesis C-methylase UbiE